MQCCVLLLVVAVVVVAVADVVYHDLFVVFCEVQVRRRDVHVPDLLMLKSLLHYT